MLTANAGIGPVAGCVWNPGGVKVTALVPQHPRRVVRLQPAVLDQRRLKTENGVASADWGKAAWFLDSEGNIINISQRA